MALDGRGREHFPVAGADLLNFPFNHAYYRLREIAAQVGQRLRETPALLPFFLDNHFPVAEVAEQVHHEKRIAFGPGVNHPREFIREAVPWKLDLQVPFDVRGREKLHIDLTACATPLKIALHSNKRALRE